MDRVENAGRGASETRGTLTRSGAALVLVADSTRARLLVAADPDAELEEALVLVNPQSRLHEGDLVENDAGGRDTTDARRHQAEAFAGDVLERVGKLMHARNGQRLHVVAEPSFLGLLRRQMDPSLARCVDAEVTKSLAAQSLQAIRAALPARL